MLKDAVASERVTHAWLFTGPPGIGKLHTARVFAAALNCPAGGDGTCDTCRRILRGVHPDVHLIVPEGDNLLVEDVRAVREEASRTHHEAPTAVFILDEADRLTEAAANALLKVLEEPPPEVVFVLVVRSAEALVGTVPSRARTLPVREPVPGRADRRPRRQAPARPRPDRLGGRRQPRPPGQGQRPPHRRGRPHPPLHRPRPHRAPGLRPALRRPRRRRHRGRHRRRGRGRRPHPPGARGRRARGGLRHRPRHRRPPQTPGDPPPPRAPPRPLRRHPRLPGRPPRRLPRHRPPQRRRWAGARSDWAPAARGGPRWSTRTRLGTFARLAAGVDPATALRAAGAPSRRPTAAWPSAPPPSSPWKPPSSRPRPPSGAPPFPSTASPSAADASPKPISLAQPQHASVHSAFAPTSSAAPASPSGVVVAHPTRNRKVVGSNPTSGSTNQQVRACIGRGNCLPCLPP